MNHTEPQKNGFTFTYSAREQAEVKRIREKYTGGQAAAEDKLSRLRRLDAGVTEAAQTVALVLGIVGALLFGLGLSLVMTELPALIGLGTTVAAILGILIGISGGVLAGLAYPAYCAVVRRRRAKVAPEILRLTDELMEE